MMRQKRGRDKRQCITSFRAEAAGRQAHKKIDCTHKKDGEELINTTAGCLPYSKFRLFHETGAERNMKRFILSTANA